MLGALMFAAPARAQDVGRVDVGAGARWIGPIRFDEVDATETALGGTRRTLFKTTTDLNASTGGEVRVSVRLTSVLHGEGSLAFNRTHLTTQVTADAEGADNTTITEPVTQYLVEGGVLLELTRWHIGGIAPFLTGGAGYLRQLHTGHTLVVTGQSFYAGGGATYLLMSRDAGKVKATGIRADVRATFLSNGVAPDNRYRAAPSVSGSLFVRF